MTELLGNPDKPQPETPASPRVQTHLTPGSWAAIKAGLVNLSGDPGLLQPRGQGLQSWACTPPTDWRLSRCDVTPACRMRDVEQAQERA